MGQRIRSREIDITIRHLVQRADHRTYCICGALRDEIRLLELVPCRGCGSTSASTLVKRHYSVDSAIYVNPACGWYHQTGDDWAETHRLGELDLVAWDGSPNHHRDRRFCSKCKTYVLSREIWFGFPRPNPPRSDQMDLDAQNLWAKQFESTRGDVWNRFCAATPIITPTLREAVENSEGWPELFAFHAFVVAAYASLDAKTIDDYVGGMMIWLDQWLESH